MTEQAIFDRVKALIDENAALKAGLKQAQERIAELERITG